MKIKFKKLFKWSLPAIIITTGAFVSSHTSANIQNKEEVQKAATTIKDNRPEIRIRYDTIYLTEEYLDTNKSINLGLFLPTDNSVSMKHFVPVDSTKRVMNFAQTHNSQRAAILRHELEHGRKAHLWANTEDRAPFVRGQIACMNEVMAPAGEVIESAENEWLTGIPTQGPDMLKKTTSAILDENRKTPFGLMGGVDFTNQKIADIVLKYAIDKYIREFNRGVYKWPVRKKLDANRKHINYKPNKECNPMDKIMFFPESGDWSQMFAYKTKSGKNINIWKSASEKMRREVRERVDSATNSLLKPGEYLTAFKTPEKK